MGKSPEPSIASEGTTIPAISSGSDPSMITEKHPLIQRRLSAMLLLASFVSVGAVVSAAYLTTNSETDPGGYGVLGIMAYILVIFPVLIILSLVAGRLVQNHYQQLGDVVMSPAAQYIAWAGVIAVIIAPMFLPPLFTILVPIVLTMLVRQVDRF